MTTWDHESGSFEWTDPRGTLGPGLHRGTMTIMGREETEVSRRQWRHRSKDYFWYKVSKKNKSRVWDLTLCSVLKLFRTWDSYPTWGLPRFRHEDEWRKRGPDVSLSEGEGLPCFSLPRFLRDPYQIGIIEEVVLSHLQRWKVYVTPGVSDIMSYPKFRPDSPNFSD